MSKLGGLFRPAIRSNLAARTVGASPGGAFSVASLRERPRHFSTESEPHDAAVDSFLRTQSSGSVYGRLTGITANTLRTDIVRLLEGCGVTLEDVKVEHNRLYYPIAVMVHFSFLQAYNQAGREINKKGGIYKLERAGQRQWDLVKPYDGKSVLLQGIPREGTLVDIERFLSGCQYDASSIDMFMRAAIKDKLATVRFLTQTQAMNCFITKNKGYCLNNQVLVRVLQ